MTVNICTVSQCLSIETRDKIFEIEIFDYRGKIWELYHGRRGFIGDYRD